MNVVEAGFITALGAFENVMKAANGKVTEMCFKTPRGTTGSVILGGVEGSLVSSTGEQVQLVNGQASGLKGGTWTLRI